MEDDLDYGKDMTLEELEQLEEVDVEFDKNAGHVKGGICPNCNEKFVKVVENREVVDWVTLHITKLKCPKCGEEYLDLDNAEKYDMLLRLEKAFKQPMNVLSKKVESLV
jgi:Zn finger protein HypA/HybF involved in hydrogenase expression